MKTLKNYCEINQVSLEELSKITNVSRAQLYLIANNPLYNITALTAKKIYKGTLKKFGQGLDIWQYISR